MNNEIDNFLPFLKRQTSSLSVKAGKMEQVFFCLNFDEKGAFVSVVDKSMKEVEVDYHAYSGDVFNVLRSLEAINEKNRLQFSWDGELSRVYLGDYNYLLYQLIRCDNLRDAKGKTLKSKAAVAVPYLLVQKKGEGLTSGLALQTEDGEKQGLKFLSDSFVLAGTSIYPIEPVGENYGQIQHFISSFATGMLETYLSIFFSYINNVRVTYEDYEMEYSTTEVVTSPALVFEKVDEDKALYLHVTHMLQGESFQLAERFDLTWQASLNVDRKIILKRIIRQSLDPFVDRLQKTILKYASDKQLKKEVYQEGSFFIVPADIAAPFLLNALPSLLDDFVLLGADKLREYKVKVVHPELKLSLSSGIDFLEGDAELKLDGETLSLHQVLQQFRKQKYVVLSDGNRAILDESYMKRLERIFKRTKEGKKIAVSFFDLPEVEDLLNERLEGEAFVKHRLIYEGFNNLATSKLKLPELNATLRAYQYEGVKWINYLHENNLGGCLADDMGLGKTIQAIAMLARIYPKTKQPSLLVMPRSLIFNWQNELARFAPQLSVYTYYGNTRDLPEAMKSELILTTYAMVRNDAEQLCKKKFHYVILDESQNIKNVNAQTTQAVLLLQTKHRLALSGTPIENNLTELYSLFRFLNPAMFGTLDDFNHKYTNPIQKDNDKEVMRSLRKKIYPFMLRRLKKDVLTELPDRIAQTLYVEMGKEQAELYEQRRRYYYEQVKRTIAEEGVQKSQFVMFQALNELRRLASVPESLSDGMVASPKLEVLVEAVSEAVSNGHKVVIFFNYIAGIELVGEQLDNYGIDFVSMTGSTRDRRSLVERFQNDTHCKVFLMTLKTGGVGLNLTAADTVFIFEPWWNKAAEEQAVNRLHRMGQTNKVLSYSMITRQSIEEKICLLQEKKSELFAGLIGNDASSAKNLSEEDIDYILG